MFTDKTIEITCEECQMPVVGVDAMAQHILDLHSDYSSVQAFNFARVWADATYDAAEEFEKEYDEDRRLDKAIHADSFPDK